MSTFPQWPDCLNARDLGGLSAVDGRQIQSGALIRSDNLDRLTPAGVAAVRAAGVGRIVDVRSRWESDLFRSPFHGEPWCLNRPMDSDDVSYDPALPLHRNYAALLDGEPAVAAAAVGAIADAPPGGVVVHCHEGKDRTGMVVALTLRAVGVPTTAVVADYAMVSERQRAAFDDKVAGAEDATERTRLAEEYSADPQTMVALLAHLEDRYGDVAGYLRRGGLTDSRIAALHARLLG